MSPRGSAADSPGEVHDRLLRWHGQVRAAIASQRLDLPFARVFITDDLPEVYDLNLVAVTTQVPPAVLLRSVERIAVTAQWEHRRVEIDDPAVAATLRAPLIDAGYAEQRFVTMALTGPSELGDDLIPSTAVVAIAAQRDLGRRLIAEEPWADSEALIDQMTDREHRLGRVAGGRAVIAPPDDPVSRCLLLVSDGLAEIDTVSTLDTHRGQGWSRAVMRRAIDAARDLGAEDVVLVADADDWPRAWYRRLGFREVGRSFAYLRAPER
ncbi:MAG: GNAT family N-acetyltransferase [Actinobacteria bacterium]|nr:GNAT family N-acetyltransferase [Actinomycetota bacterium]